MKQKELEEIIKYHQQLYYDGIPEISDDEFDNLWTRLKSTYPTSKVLREIGSSNTTFEKVKHTMMMGSQNKAMNENDFHKWYVQHQNNQFVVEFKLDGASIALQYVNGILNKAITRGNGEYGDDITVNVKKMKGVPKQIDLFTGTIRGEVVLFKSNKDKYFPEMANCRNAAVGIMKGKEGEGCEYLNVIVYDIQGNLNFSLETEKLIWLDKNNFNVVEFQYNEDFTEKDIVQLRNDFNEKRHNLDYDIDGLVIKCNTINIQDLQKDRPEHQIAFKFQKEEIETELIDIIWSQSGKTFTPIAKVKPVQLNGTTVKQASLANRKRVEDLIVQGMMIGSKVIISKRGEIIPYLERLV